jgi:hypothetical protein
VAIRIEGFSFRQKIDQHESEKTVVLTFPAEGTVLAFFLSGDKIPFRACCFVSGSKRRNRHSSPVSKVNAKHRTRQDVVEATAMTDVMRLFVCSSVKKQRTKRKQTFRYPNVAWFPMTNWAVISLTVPLTEYSPLLPITYLIPITPIKLGVPQQKNLREDNEIQIKIPRT